MATGRGTHALAFTPRSLLQHGSRLKSTVLSALFVLALIASAVQEGLPQADPPFAGTVYMDPDIITASDPTTFLGVTAAGRGVRIMFDRRADAFGAFNAYLFNATFDDGLSAEIQVNPEFGSSSAAMAEAEHYGRIIGRLPTVLRAELETVWIHKGDELLGGGNNNILIHTDHAEVSEQNGFLEEELAHEGAHTSLDAAHADAPDWRAAQIRDGGYISTYARDFPDREDIAESFVPYLAVRYRSERIPASVEQSILNAIPNRIAYFDAQSFDMYPVVSGEGGGNGSDSFTLTSSISGASGQASGSNAGASKESGEPNHAGTAGGASLWWSWTAPASGTVTIDTEGSDFDTVLAVYTGSGVGALTSVASNDDAIGRQSEVSFAAQQGIMYHIAVDGYSGATGSIVLNWSQADGSGMACIPDPSLACGTAITCVDGLEYPTTCGPRNCDLPIGMCAVVAAGSDSFSLASSISGASGQASGSNAAASKESGEPNHAGNAGGASLWWSWTAPASGTVTIDTEGSDFDTVLAVYTGSSIGFLTSVASNDDAIGRQSEVSFAAQQGIMYHIAVDGYSGATGSIVLNWSQADGSGMACIPDPSLACGTAITCVDGLEYPTTCGPRNCDLPIGMCAVVAAGSDSFSLASSISGASGQASGSNAAGSKESGEPDHAGNAGGASLWWSWTAPASGTVTIDTEGSDFDTVLAVYTGSGVGALTSVASNDDAIGRQSEVSFAAQQGIMYHIAVDGYSGATGSIVLNWSQADGSGMACIPDPSLACGTAITCVDGLEYPTTCGPRNCDLPIGMCAVVAAGSDSFSLASSISGASGQASGSNAAASKESGEPDHAGNAGGASLWWSWTAPASGTVTIDTEGSDFDTVLAVYTGSGVGALTSVASNDDAIGRQSEVSFAAQQGIMYHIAVDGYSGATGSIVLNWSQADGSGMACIPDPSLACTAAFTCFDGLLYPTGCGPRNCDLPVGTCETEDPVTVVGAGSDSFSSASSISGASGQASGSNAGASKESGEPDHAGIAGGASLWWSWAAPASGAVTIDTEGSDFDTVLAVYTGDGVGALTVVASNDDAIGRQSEVSFEAQQGTVYRIAVDGYSGATGSIVLGWSQGQPPSSSYGAVSFDLLEGCSGYAFGVVSNHSTQQDALQTAIGLCQDQGGLPTECTDHSIAYSQCAAVAYGENQTSCYLGNGFGSSATAARQDALTDCRNKPGALNCRILTSETGNSAFCNAMDTGDLPNRDPLDDFNVAIPSSCSRQVQICVRDHQCEDGDAIRVTVNSRVEFSGELFNEPHCFDVPVREGVNSIDLIALNGTGFKGNCDHSDVNTGEIEVTGGATQAWRHRGGAGSTANLNVTVGPPGPCTSTPSSSYGAVSFDLLEGCSGYAFGVANNHSTQQDALQTAIGLCQDQGGLPTECTDHSIAYSQCAAVAYGESQTSCYIGNGFGSSATAARQDALTDCRNEPGGLNCRILTSETGNSAFCND